MGSSIQTNDLKIGMKVIVDGVACKVVSNQFVRPGKGQPFAKTKLKNLASGRVVERTYKSGEKILLADVFETQMRLLYRENRDIVLMNEENFEQISIPLSLVEEIQAWLIDDLIYTVTFLNGEVLSVEPPTFVDLQIVQTEPALRGDSSGKVMKPAFLSNEVKISVPIFIQQDEIVRIDTRTGEYVSRVQK